jgi:hypothetical protein
MGWRGSQYGGLDNREGREKVNERQAFCIRGMCTKAFSLAVGEKTGGGEGPLNNRNDFGESRSWNGDGKVEWTSKSLGPKI